VVKENIKGESQLYKLLKRMKLSYSKNDN